MMLEGKDSVSYYWSEGRPLCLIHVFRGRPPHQKIKIQLKIYTYILYVAVYL